MIGPSAVCASTRTVELSTRALFSLCTLHFALFTAVNASFLPPDSVSTATPSVSFIPDSTLAAGALHRCLFGDLWRDIWTLPAAAPVFDPAHGGGGLVRIGGTSDDTDGVIRYRGSDNSLWTFTPLVRPSSARFSSEFQELFTSGALKDLNAMAHPYAPLLTARLLEAAGVEHVRPELVVLDDQAGAVRSAGAPQCRPGYLERWPAGDTLIDSFTLLRRLEENGAERVDAAAYLTARILGILTGDWDGPIDAWGWVCRQREGNRVWEPVAPEGSNSFSRFDGLIPWTSTLFLPIVEPWSASAPSMGRLTWAGRHLDRWLLSPLGKREWDSVTAVTASRLTDSVIELSVRALPTSVCTMIGPALTAGMKSRRDELPGLVDAYYRSLAKTVDIHCTDAAEVVEITRTDDAHVAVRVTGPGGGEGASDAVVQCDRMFSTSETNEIRLYLKGGGDRVVIRGDVASSIPVRVIGGEGNDVFIDSSHVSGYWLGLVPFVRDAETCTYVYDAEGTKVEAGDGTAVRDVDSSSAENDTLRFAPSFENRGYAVDWGALVDWNSEFGPMVGGGPIFTSFDYEARPYASQMSVFAGFAPFAGVGKVVADADWRGAVRNVALTLNVMASGFEMLTYFGRGNETALLLRANDPYYRVHQTQLRVEPAARWPAVGPLSLTVRTGMRYAYAEHRPNKYVTDVRPYGIGDMTLVTLGAGVRWDTRDDDVQPHTGAYVDLSGTYVPKAFSIGEAFGRMKGDLRVFVTAGREHAATFSVRVLGDRTWGKMPFFEAATIGSSSALRGYQQGRFAGASSVVGIVEARVRLGRIDIITPVPFGVFGFAETGRVFEPGEDSRRWHPSFGGGVWAAPWKRDATLTASIGVSKESVMVYGAVGFGF